MLIPPPLQLSIKADVCVFGIIIHFSYWVVVLCRFLFYVSFAEGDTDLWKIMNIVRGCAISNFKNYCRNVIRIAALLIKWNYLGWLTYKSHLRISAICGGGCR